MKAMVPPLTPGTRSAMPMQNPFAVSNEVFRIFIGLSYQRNNQHNETPFIVSLYADEQGDYLHLYL